MTELYAGCKINLGLHITGIREDGYHELSSIFLPLPEPHDILRLESNGGSSVAVRFSQPGIDPENNTIVKAWRLFGRAAGPLPGLSVEVDKGIPAGAGLGGGSSDAACLLAWLNNRAGNRLPPGELAAIAAAVGADVPFFLQPRPCLVTGAGEILEPLASDDFNAIIVLACPDLHVSTRWAFERYDAMGRPFSEPCPYRGLTSADDGDKASFRFSAVMGGGIRHLQLARQSIGNDLEAAVFPSFPVLSRIRETLEDWGALMSGMTGSGSAIYGVFSSEDLQKARAAANFLSQTCGRVFVVPHGNVGM